MPRRKQSQPRGGKRLAKAVLSDMVNEVKRKKKDPTLKEMKTKVKQHNKKYYIKMSGTKSDLKARIVAYSNAELNRRSKRFN